MSPGRSHRGEALYLHTDTILVLTIEHLHGLNGLGDGPATSDKHAINIESKGEVISDFLFLNRGYWSRKW